MVIFMRRMIAILTALILLCLSGCSVKEELPKGVCEHGDKEYYRIMLPYGRNVGSQFALKGPKNTMVVSFFGESGGSQGNVAVYFQEVEQGGWVAYTGSGTGLILYFSSRFTVEQVQLACTDLTRSKDNYMSWDQAKEYIQWLE